MLSGVAALLAVGTFLFGAALVVGINQWSLDDEDLPQKAPNLASGASSPFSAPTASSAGQPARMAFESTVKIGFDVYSAFEKSWAAIQRAPGTLWLAGLLMAIAECRSNSPNDSSSGDEYAALETTSSQVALLQSEWDTVFEQPVFIVGVLAAGVLCFGLQVAFRSWLVPGLIRMNTRMLRHHEGGFSELFGGIDRAAAIFGWRLLRMGLLFIPVSIFLVPMVGVGVGAGLMGTDIDALFKQPEVVPLLVLLAFMALVLWLYLAPITFLTEMFIVLDNHDPITALKLSSRAAQGNRITLTVFALVTLIVQAVVGVLGLLFFCVGVVFTVPIAQALYELMWVHAFLLARHGMGRVVVLSEPDAGL